MPRKSTKVQLSGLQLAVIRVLWQRREASTSDIAAALQRERGLAHTTVATLLTRLVKRGLLEQRREGRHLVYRALVAEEDVRRSMVSDLVTNLFRGDAGELLAHLVRAHEVQSGDAQRIRERLKGDARG